jgi:hypothetical protein
MTSRFYCEYCDVTCGRPADWQRHISTKKHNQAQNNDSKNTQRFICLDCDYKCCKNSILERHKMSNRHKLRIKPKNDIALLDNASVDDSSQPKLQSLSNCVEITQSESEITQSESENSRLDYMTIILELMKQTNELKNFIIEQAIEQKNYAIEQKKD